MAPQSGDRILGKYRVECVLGAGGMATVYAATDEHLHRTVAIKLLNETLTADQQGARLALREARAAVQLRSEHVARVLDAGLDEHGTPYIVMEFLEGEDLRQRLGKTPSIPIEETVGFIVQACEAIAEAHAAGIVHRDLKPDNLFITHGVDGLPHVKVLDFGIAKITANGSHHTTSSNKGDYGVFGSPPYTAPERLRDVKGVDPRSDIWSLGVVLYEALVGTRPFVGETLSELLVSILDDTPKPLRSLRAEIPEALETAVLHCLEKDPDKRFDSIASLAEALLPFAPDWAQAAGQRTLLMAGLWKRNTRSGLRALANSSEMPALNANAAPAAARRRRGPWWMAAAATVLVVLAAVLNLRHKSPQPPEAVPLPTAKAPPAGKPSIRTPSISDVVAHPADLGSAKPAPPSPTGSRARTPTHVGRLKLEAPKADRDPLEGRK